MTKTRQMMKIGIDVQERLALDGSGIENLHVDDILSLMCWMYGFPGIKLTVY